MKRLDDIVLIAAFAVALGATGARGQQALPVLGGALSVAVDNAAVFSLPANAQVLIVGNPAIADVAKPSRTANFAVITGKSFGQTNVIMLDSEGRQISAADIRVEPAGAPMVTVQRGADSRTTYSCAPVCARALALGDSPDVFQAVGGQVQQRQAISAPPQPVGPGYPGVPGVSGIPGANGTLPSVGNVLGAGVFGTQ